jgi:8-oxo-dGTP pyrophosphatase MutT (NUDIX family)
MTVSTPRPASTVVVVRDAAAGRAIELLLVRRNDKVAFMAGAYVFPGGRVDDDDHGRARQMPDIEAFASRFPDLVPDDELPYRIAAIREMKEEANVTLSIADLFPIAHWVTPEVETRRYDTRFFLARMPGGQIARHDEVETTELAWLTPSDALERCLEGGIMLPPPTWTTIKRLTRLSSTDAAITWAKQATIVRVQPQFVREPDRTLLTLPGDPLYPTVPGWEVPEDTRFVLVEGKGWKPLRA